MTFAWSFALTHDSVDALLNYILKGTQKMKLGVTNQFLNTKNTHFSAIML